MVKLHGRCIATFRPRTFSACRVPLAHSNTITSYLKQLCVPQPCWTAELAGEVGLGAAQWHQRHCWQQTASMPLLNTAGDADGGCVTRCWWGQHPQQRPGCAELRCSSCKGVWRQLLWLRLQRLWLAQRQRACRVQCSSLQRCWGACAGTGQWQVPWQANPKAAGCAEDNRGSSGSTAAEFTAGAAAARHAA